VNWIQLAGDMLLWNNTQNNKMKENAFEWNPKVGSCYYINMSLYSAKPGNLVIINITANCPRKMLHYKG
jgi:hypothetical protein